MVGDGTHFGGGRLAWTLVGDGAWVGAGGWGGGQGFSGVGTHGCGAGGAKQQLGAQLDTQDVEQIGGHGIVVVKVPEKLEEKTLFFTTIR